MRNSILLGVFSFLVLHPLFAQDLPPSQFFAAPLTVNPALTGLSANDIRATANCAASWVKFAANPLQSTFAAVDMPILRGALAKGDAIGFGLLYKYGAYEYNNYFYYKQWQNKVGLSLAYHKKLDKHGLHHISLGIEYLLVRDLFKDYLYPYTPIEYLTMRYGEYSVGAVYSGPLSRKIFFTAGTSLHFEGTHHSYGHSSIFVGCSTTLSKRTKLFLNTICYTYPTWYVLQLSSYVNIPIVRANNDTSESKFSLYCGGIYRYNQSLSPYVGFGIYNFRLGLTYGFNAGNNPINKDIIGGYELSLIYTGKLRKKQNPNWHCPTMY